MPVPIVYRTGGDAVINYDFADVASGTGFLTLYPHGASEGATPTSSFQLVRHTMEANPSQQSANTGSASYVKLVDIDFDYLLDKPITLSGKCLVYAPHAGNSDGTCKRYIGVRLRKWDGTTETEIAYSRGPEMSTGSGWSYSSSQLVLEIPETHLKSGESIRVTLEGWAKTFASATFASVDVSFNPAGGEYGGTGGPSSACVLQIPLRLDI
ncbi:MAG TPA: hypothetical protein EYQ21_07470 [Flavobacteriales bacterium]|jgi:hypothetical protein|nr:hypothetical protein [Flavobacteriales bacterium]